MKNESPETAQDKLSDWVPIWLAPFHYSRSRYLSSPVEYQKHIEALIQRWAGDDPAPRSISVLYGRRIQIEAHGMRLEIDGDEHGELIFYDSINDDDELQDITIIGRGRSFVAAFDAKRSPDETRPGWAWHRSLSSHLVHWLEQSFQIAFDEGVARIMARLSSPLAEFQSIAPDQWRYFKLTEAEDDEEGMPTTATGPNGEKLYSVFVAPGKAKNEEADLEMQATDYFANIMRASPEHRPKPREQFMAEALETFPGLSQRGAGRAYDDALGITGCKASWTKPGAPRKVTEKNTSQKSPRLN